MNGPEHYEAAEELLAAATETDPYTGDQLASGTEGAMKIQAAAVHAQLAAVALVFDIRAAPPGYEAMNQGEWEVVVR
jgi:hypothetical protein